ncbi:hypothetical protein VNO77_38869 [Canavalia gladiata]|uniref:Uncharacterized protein n=1 Tax=Canavalia gladiata TaxID=3824 RepID=A0AAN9KB70_CANGL
MDPLLSPRRFARGRRNLHETSSNLIKGGKNHLLVLSRRTQLPDYCKIFASLYPDPIHTSVNGRVIRWICFDDMLKSIDGSKGNQKLANYSGSVVLKICEDLPFHRSLFEKDNNHTYHYVSKHLIQSMATIKNILEYKSSLIGQIMEENGVTPEMMKTSISSVVGDALTSLLPSERISPLE